MERRGGRQHHLQHAGPDDEPQRSAVGRPLARQLAVIAKQSGLLIAEINGLPAADQTLAPLLVEAGFFPSAMGFMVRREPAGRPRTELAASNAIDGRETGGELVALKPGAKANA